MLHVYIARLLISNRNDLESECTEIRMRKENHNKLITLSIGIKIRMNYIAIDVFTLF